MTGSGGSVSSAGGTWNTAGSVLNTSINAALNNGSSLILDATGGTGGSGTITVSAPIAMTSAGNANLTLNAGTGGIAINAPISATTGQLNLSLNTTGNSSTGNITSSASGTINTNGGVLLVSSPSFNSSMTGVISGSGSLVAMGGGTLILGGANTYSGGTLISQSVVTANTNTSFGSGAITMGDANTGSNAVSVFLADGVNLVNNITLTSQGSGAATIGSVLGSNSAMFSGKMVWGRAVGLVDNSTNGTTFAGTLSGNPGTVTLIRRKSILTNSNNSFTGSITIRTGTTLEMAGNNVVPAADAIIMSGGTLSLQGGTTVQAGSLSGTGTVSVDGAFPGTTTLTIGGDNSNQTFSGVISSANSSVINLVKVGSGTQIFTGNNTYSGTTTVTAGTLQLGNGSTSRGLSASTPLFNISAGATLYLDYLGLPAYPTSSIASIGSLVTGAGTLKLNTSGTTGSLAAGGSWWGNANFTPNFTGTLDIAGGRVDVDGPSALGSIRNIVVETGAEIVFLTSNVTSIYNQSFTVSGSGWSAGAIVDDSYGALTLNGNITLTGDTTFYTESGTSGSFNMTGVISGNYNVTYTDIAQVGFILSGNNTYSGDTTLTTGILQFGLGGSGGNLASANIVNNGDLDFYVNVPLTYSGNISGTGFLVAAANPLILTGNNTYTGGTIIAGGTLLQIGNGGSSGTLGTGGVTGSGTLAFDLNNSVTFDQV
ncbi:MAG: beta strand repeat-containing protein, partial [Enterobacteriaceae bacterium]